MLFDVIHIKNEGDHDAFGQTTCKQPDLIICFPPEMHPEKISACEQVPKQRQRDRIRYIFTLSKERKKDRKEERKKERVHNCSKWCRKHGALLLAICTLWAPDLHNFPWIGRLCCHQERIYEQGQLYAQDFLRRLLQHKCSRSWSTPPIVCAEEDKHSFCYSKLLVAFKRKLWKLK